MSTRRIHLINGYRGKDMKDIFYPKGDHDFPAEIAQRLIQSGQAIALEEDQRNRLQDFVGTQRNVAVTVEQVLSKVATMTDEQIIELAHLNDITIPDATTREKAIAALVSVALRADAALVFSESKAKAPVIQHSRLAENEQERLLMLNDAGKLDDVPRVVDPKLSAEEAALLINPLTGVPYTDDPDFDFAVMAKVRSGELALDHRDAQKRYLIALGAERGVSLEESLSKALMIEALNKAAK